MPTRTIKRRLFARLGLCGSPRTHRDAILFHEIGHLLTGPNASEAAANRAIQGMTGVTIYYLNTRYGHHLESLNPEVKIHYGKTTNLQNLRKV